MTNEALDKARLELTRHLHGPNAQRGPWTDAIEALARAVANEVLGDAYREAVDGLNKATDREINAAREVMGGENIDEQIAAMRPKQEWEPAREIMGEGRTDELSDDEHYADILRRNHRHSRIAVPAPEKAGIKSGNDLIERLRKASLYLASDYGYEHATTCNEAAEALRTAEQERETAIEMAERFKAAMERDQVALATLREQVGKAEERIDILEAIERDYCDRNETLEAALRKARKVLTATEQSGVDARLNAIAILDAALSPLPGETDDGRS